MSNVTRRRTAPISSAETPAGGRAGRSGLLLAALGVLTFSFSLPLTKIAVRSMSPYFTGVGRAVVAAVPAAIVLRARRVARPVPATLWRFTLVVGGVVVGFPVLTALALQHVPSTHGSIVNGLLPLVTAGVAVVRAGERPSAAYWACSVVGVGAVAAYALSKGGGRLHLADLLLVAAVLAAAVGYAEGALLARTMPGWQVICWALVIGLPVTVPIAALHVGGVGRATLGQWVAFGYTAFFSMLIGFFFWYAGLAKAGISRGGQLQLAQPALSLLWAWPLLGERLDVAGAATAVIVLGAVVIGRRTAISSRNRS